MNASFIVLILFGSAAVEAGTGPDLFLNLFGCGGKFRTVPKKFPTLGEPSKSLKRGAPPKIARHTESSFAQEAAGSYAFLLVYDRQKPGFRLYSTAQHWKMDKKERQDLLSHLVRFSEAAMKDTLEEEFKGLNLPEISFQHEFDPFSELYRALKGEGRGGLNDRGLDIVSAGTYQKVGQLTGVKVASIDSLQPFFHPAKTAINSISAFQFLVRFFERDFSVDKLRVSDYTVQEEGEQLTRTKKYFDDSFVFRQMVNGVFGEKFFTPEYHRLISKEAYAIGQKIDGIPDLSLRLTQKQQIEHVLSNLSVDEDTKKSLETSFSNLEDFKAIASALSKHDLGPAFFLYSKDVLGKKSFMGAEYSLNKTKEKLQLIKRFYQFLVGLNDYVGKFL